MNAALIANWNAKVTKDDDVYFLGDWSLDPRWYRELARLNFRMLYWALGNHDYRAKLLSMVERRFPHLKDKIVVADNFQIKIGEQDFHLCHRPILGRDDMPTICGHVHEKWLMRKPGDSLSEHSKAWRAMPPKLIIQPILNVGVDQHNMRPISEDEVLAFFRSTR